MSRRFYHVRKGAEYDKALNSYVDYIRNADTRPTKRLQGGVRGSRRTTEPAAVRPFGMELDGGYALTRISTEAQTGIGSSLTSRTFTSGANLTAAVRVQGFKPARVTAFRGTGAAAYVESKITKLYYLKYTGDTYTAPIGALSDTEEEQAGGAAVKAAIITAFGASEIKRVSISPEKVPI